MGSAYDLETYVGYQSEHGYLRGYVPRRRGYRYRPYAHRPAAPTAEPEVRQMILSYKRKTYYGF